MPDVIPIHLKLAFLAAALIAAFSCGWAVNGWRYDARIAIQKEEALKQKDGYDQLARWMVEKWQTDSKAAQKRKDDRDVQIDNLPDNRVCFADWNAVRLWNESISGASDVSKNTAGTVDGSRPVTVTDILRNINENGKRWEECRSKINAIKKLQDEAFGK